MGMIFTEPRSATSRRVKPSLVSSTPLRKMEVRAAPGPAAFSGRAEGSLGSAAKAAGENWATERIPASVQSNAS